MIIAIHEKEEGGAAVETFNHLNSLANRKLKLQTKTNENLETCLLNKRKGKRVWGESRGEQDP
jgi:hypothetical protein